MVELTLEMIQAGAKAFNRLHGDCCYPVAMDAEAEAAAIKIYGDMVRADTRPTADLGDDGELRAAILDAKLARTNWQKYNGESADEVVYQAEKMATAIDRIARAVLSRSGG